MNTRRLRPTGLHVLVAWGALFAGFSSDADAITLRDGDVVVLEQGGSGPPAALIRIDPSSGSQEVISAGGLLGPGIPFGFTYDRVTRSFFVVGRSPSLIRIDAVTGEQTLFRKLPLRDATGIAIEANGDFLVTDFGVSTDELHGRLLRVSRNGRSVTVLAQGGLLDSIAAIAVQIDGSGNPIVSGFGTGLSRIIRVDARTGEQQLLAESSTENFYDFALAGGTAYVASSTMGRPSGMDRVVALDLESGEMTTVFEGLLRVLDVDVDAEGRLVVLDQCFLACALNPVVYRSNSSGRLEILSQGGYIHTGFMSVPSQVAIVRTRFDFAFLGPVMELPVVNRVTAGRTVPIRFGLGGDMGQDVFADGSPTVRPVPCDAASPINDIAGVNSRRTSSLRYVPARNRYTYLWQTDKSWAGTCQELSLELVDGSVHEAIFRFERTRTPRGDRPF